MFYLYFLYHNAGNYINFSTRGENISIKTLRSGFIIDLLYFYSLNELTLQQTLFPNLLP